MNSVAGDAWPLNPTLAGLDCFIAVLSVDDVYSQNWMKAFSTINFVPDHILIATPFWKTQS